MTTENTFTITVPRPRFAVGQRVKTKHGIETVLGIGSLKVRIEPDGHESWKGWEYTFRGKDRGWAYSFYEDELEAVTPAETEGGEQ